MDSVNKTLYIPLYGKAYVSRRGIILHDERAEKIWAAEGFALRGKAASKWLACYMGMRAAVCDRWLAAQMAQMPDAVVFHVGCGMDSRVCRVGTGEHRWFDVDFPEVIWERRRYFAETVQYRMIGADLREDGWLAELPKGVPAVIVMEGVSMYLRREELNGLLKRWKAHFSQVRILMDTYTEFAAKATRYKNPINQVGVTEVFGLDDPQVLTEGTGMELLGEHDMTPPELIAELTATERWVFSKLFAGKMAKRFYRMYEYRA